MDCGILFSTYDLLISSKSLGREAKAQLKAAKQAEHWKLQQGKDDGEADKIQFGVLTLTLNPNPNPSHTLRRLPISVA